MQRRLINPLVFILGFCAVFALLTSCATPLTKSGMIDRYEDIGFTLQTVQITLSAMEINGTLAGDKLVSAKKSYNDARKLYLDAGEALKFYVSAKTLDDALSAREKYRTALAGISTILITLTSIYGGK